MVNYSTSTPSAVISQTTTPSASDYLFWVNPSTNKSYWSDGTNWTEIQINQPIDLPTGMKFHDGFLDNAIDTGVWTSSTSGTASNTISSGIASLSTGGTSGAVSYLRGLMGLDISNYSEIIVNLRIKISNDTNINSSRAYPIFQLGNANPGTTAGEAIGIYKGYFFCTHSNTATEESITLDTTTDFIDIKISYTSTSCSIYLNNVLTKTITTNIPTGAISPTFSISNTANETKILYIDKIIIKAI